MSSSPDSSTSTAASPSATCARPEPARPNAPAIVKRPKRLRNWWLPMSAVVIAAALVGLGWQRQSADTAMAAQASAAARIPAVRVHLAAPAAGDAQLTLPATMEPRQRTELHARVSGYVKRWHADLGQRVAAGDVLAEIETPDLDQDVRRAEAAVVEARAALGLAQSMAERVRQLMRENAVARQELDARESELRVRQAALAAAEAALARVQEMTRFQLIRAPFEGVVTARRLEVGDLVVAGAGGQGLFVLEQTEVLRTFVDLPQAYARAVRPGMTAQVSLREMPDRHFEARVMRTAGALNSATRSMRVELEIPNGGGALLAGAFGQVRFTLVRSEPVLAVPVTAVRHRGDGAFVAVVGANEEISLRNVKLGDDLGREIEILDGLSAGERVVRSPTDLLRPGTKVHVIAATATK